MLNKVNAYFLGMYSGEEIHFFYINHALSGRMEFTQTSSVVL